MYYDPEGWIHAPAYKASGIDVVYRSVTEHFDRLLAARGYERGDHLYAAVRPRCGTFLPPGERCFCFQTAVNVQLSLHEICHRARIWRQQDSCLYWLFR